MRNLNDMTFDAVLTETQDYFQSQGVSIVGKGYEEIASNRALFESYVDKLNTGASADSAATLTQLMENTNAEILTENSLTGIQPISSLAMPVIRKLWPKFALKDAMRTQVAKTPRFTITYTKPYLVRGDEKIYLPYGLKDAAGNLTGAAKKDYTYAVVTLANGSAVSVDFTKTSATAVLATNGVNIAAEDVAKVVVTDTPSRIKTQPLDELAIIEAYSTPATGDGDLALAISGSVVTPSKGTAYVACKIGKRLDVTGSAIYDLADGQLIVKFEGASDKCTLAYVGATGDDANAVLVLRAGVSTEFNENGWDAGFDMPRQDIDIPTGQHINANLPIEFLNDAMATYQIDATKEIVDIMTNVCAMRLDLEALDFIQESFVNLPANEAFFGDPNFNGGAKAHTVVFDCIPMPGFAGTPKAWREQIRTAIDYLAQQIKNETYLGAGQFKIVCNPLDAMLISNVNWEFQGGSTTVDGVSVDYSVGTFQGANFYSIISSVNVPQGMVYVVFLPETNTQMTYCYFPYSFSTSLGYVSPNRSRVPSVMMTKRHTFAEFIPAVGVVEVLNNTGAPYAQYVNAATATTGYPDTNWTRA